MDDDLYDEFGNFMYVSCYLHDVVTSQKGGLSGLCFGQDSIVFLRLMSNLVHFMILSLSAVLTLDS